MAHGTLIGGAAYGITGGKCLVGGTEYSIKKGRTLIGGTGYDVSFGRPTRITTVTSATPNIDERWAHFTINNGATKYTEIGIVLDFQPGESVVVNAHVGMSDHVIVVDGVADSVSTDKDVDCTGYDTTIDFLVVPFANTSRITITRNQW